MKEEEPAVAFKAPKAKVDGLAAECLKTREENVNMKERVQGLRRNTSFCGQNTYVNKTNPLWPKLSGRTLALQSRVRARSLPFSRLSCEY